jgi:hypothetical protein
MNAAEMKMTIDGFDFERRPNGCIWVNGSQVYKFSANNPSQKEAVLAAHTTYRAAIKEQVQAEEQESRRQNAAHAHAAAASHVDYQQARRDFDEL